MAWVGTIIGFSYAFPFFDFIAPGNYFVSISLLVNILFIVGIPLVGISLTVARLFFGTRLKPVWQYILIALLIANVSSFFMIGTQQVRKFNQAAEVNHNTPLSIPDSDTLQIKWGDNPYNKSLIQLGDQLKLADQKLVSQQISINIEKSDHENFELVQRNHSRGFNIQEAQQLAQSINYTPKYQAPLLELPSVFILEKGSKWRAQHIELTLRVPDGKYLDLRNLEYSGIMWELPKVNSRNRRSWYHDDIPHQLWKMEADGWLSCTDCGESQNSDIHSMEQFSHLNLEGNIKATITQGAEYNYEIKNQEDLGIDLEVVQTGKMLYIATPSDYNEEEVRLYITAPQLHSIEATNTANIRIQGFEQPKLSLNLIGDYETKADIIVDSLIIYQSEHNRLDLRGSTNNLSAKIKGSSDLDAEKINIKIADVSAVKGSSVALNRLDTLSHNSDNSSRVKVEDALAIKELR